MEKINIDNLTIGQIKEISKMIGIAPTVVQSEKIDSDDKHWEIGENYNIRTVTMHFLGTLISVTKNELLLKDCAWIAESGRFNEYLQDVDTCKEAETYKNNVIINRGSLIDATIVDAVILETR